jgi:rhodanese-related sulfurtransferase
MAIGIGLEEVRKLITGGAQLVEVLPEKEYREAHLPGAINLPLKRVTAQTTGVLDRQRAVVVYCWDAL